MTTRQELAPTLERLNRVTAMLEKNRDNIGKAPPGLKKFQITQGEAVSNGFYYNAFIPNLQPGADPSAVLRLRFGFRRGADAGQPPDNAGPRPSYRSRTTEFRLPWRTVEDVRSGNAAGGGRN